MDDPYFTFDLINQIIVLQLTLFKLLFVFLATILENVFLWFNGKEIISRNDSTYILSYLLCEPVIQRN